MTKSKRKFAEVQAEAQVIRRQLLALLPGTTAQLAERAGINIHPVSNNLYGLRDQIHTSGWVIGGNKKYVAIHALGKGEDAEKPIVKTRRKAPPLPVCTAPYRTTKPLLTAHFANKNSIFS